MFLLHAFVLLSGFFHVRLLDGFDEIFRDLNAFLEIHKEGRGASTLNVSSLLPGRAFSSLPLRGHLTPKMKTFDRGTLFLSCSSSSSFFPQEFSDAMFGSRTESTYPHGFHHGCQGRQTQGTSSLSPSSSDSSSSRRHDGMILRQRSPSIYALAEEWVRSRIFCRIVSLIHRR